MNKAIILPALLASLLVSFSALAADTAELKVTGVIKPPACSPTLAGGGVVDFGTIAARSLQAGQYTRLPSKEIDFRISCDSATKVAMKVTDNRSSSLVAGIADSVSVSRTADAYNFGLGTVAGKNVGGYVLTLSSESNADGNVTRKIFSPNGTTWHLGALDLRNNGSDYFSFGDSNNQPISFKQLTLKIDVKVILNKPENLPLSQDVPLDGSATIEVVYL